MYAEDFSEQNGYDVLGEVKVRSRSHVHAVSIFDVVRGFEVLGQGDMFLEQKIS